jgi:mannose-6-phosphate isomerase-like protein (cupin superfamily)
MKGVFSVKTQPEISLTSNISIGREPPNPLPAQQNSLLQAIFWEPAMGRTLNFAGTLTTIKVSGASTNGVYCVAEYWLPPSFPGPPPHMHRRIEHTWYVLEGSPQVQLGQRSYPTLAGACVYIPIGVAHTFSNPGNKPCRMLAIDTPGDFEAYYEALARAFPGDTPVDPQTIVEIQRRFDTYPLDSFEGDLK